MRFKTLTALCLATLLTSGAAFAQTTTTAPRPSAPAAAPATMAPTTMAPATAPTTTAAPHAAAAVPAGTKVNVNTATAAQLDALPQIGKARSKVILTERAKSPFKDWADFDTRTQHTSVNAGVKAKIKDLVTF